MYYILLTVALFAAGMGQSTLAWGLVYALAILAIYGWIATTGVTNRVAVRLYLPDGNLFSGEQAEARLTISNTTRLPILWLLIRQDLPPGLEVEGELHGSRVIALAGLETREFVFRLGSLRRGIYAFGPLVLETGDLLGLNRQRLEKAHTQSIVVYPTIHDLSGLRTPSRLAFGSPKSPRMLTEDPSWVKGVRDYSQGDPLSRIHWRATAHAGRLQTRQLEPAVTLDSAIVLNLEHDAYPPRYADALVELAIEVAASMVTGLLARRCTCRLILTTGGVPLLWGKRPVDAPGILKALAGLQAGQGVHVSEAAKAGAGSIGMGGIVYIITPQIDDALVGATYSIASIGRSPVLVHVCPRDRVPSRMTALNRGPLEYVRAQRGLAAQSLELITPSGRR